MTIEGKTVRLRPGRDELGELYTVANGEPDAVDVPLELALHARITPIGLAERVLRAAVDGGRTEGIPDDPTALPPKRTRAGAIIVRDGMVPLIKYLTPHGELRYEIPGGGVEEGEDLHATLAREITEETGMTGRAVRHIATVYRTSERFPGLYLDHYFLAEAEGEFGPLETLDLDAGMEPVWVPLADVVSLPVWPRRIRWRIAHWHAHGWPETPLVLADRNAADLAAPCHW
ncbi:hypothetical protein Afil01_46810 [Actinorhabdospora filicis]|uniref:Nudix hydrolase domain-containing protein n=1 Tax=Actinorhabdospora filicis TaxID=1785913 RepID=A0A9W6SMY7_9ACTN|nr:NUDIX domain-containing protein [Actinorhabdospora filicis]GLZ79874.1 hypothetical protein Afil01_46810 [Actinorhabdospora filicis]